MPHPSMTTGMLEVLERFDCADNRPLRLLTFRVFVYVGSEGEVSLYQIGRKLGVLQSILFQTFQRIVSDAPAYDDLPNLELLETFTVPEKPSIPMYRLTSKGQQWFREMMEHDVSPA